MQKVKEWDDLKERLCNFTQNKTMDTKNSCMKSFDVVTDWILCGFAQRVENNLGINLDGNT